MPANTSNTSIDVCRYPEQAERLRIVGTTGESPRELVPIFDRFDEIKGFDELNRVLVAVL